MEKRLRFKKNSWLGRLVGALGAFATGVRAVASRIAAFFLGIGSYFRQLPKKSKKQRLTVLASAAVSAVALVVLVAVLIAVGVQRGRAAETMAAETDLDAGVTPAPSVSATPAATVLPEATATPVWIEKRNTGAVVTNIQERLMELGYLDIDETTDYFGSGTEYAVKLFQRQHGLDQDGIIGAQTFALLFSDEAQPYVMMEGAEGRDVKMLQQQLEDLGYLKSSSIDSIYGETTIAAVKNFQKRNGLTADGKAGEKTLAMLYSDDARISYTLQKQQEKEEKKEEDKSSVDTKISKLISAAKSKIGCEYVLGDRGPTTFDCSGLLYYCLRQAGVSVKRLNASGYSNKSSWTKISDYSKLQKGDLLFFRSDSSSGVSHCGIYIGSGMMIDASSANGKVMKRTFSGSAYWKRNFVCARRPWS